MEKDVLTLSGNLFSFVNTKCDCLIDTSHNANGTEFKTLLVKGTNETIQFAYTPNDGLVRMNPKTGSVESGNVFAELLSVPYDDIDAIKKYISNNGFFIPISTEMYEKYPFNQIYNLFRRIKFTAELMSMLQESRKNYWNILSRICWLIFMQPVELMSTKYAFKSCIHSIHEYISEIQSANEDDSRLEGHDYDDPNTGIYCIPDSVRQGITELDYLEYHMFMSESEWDGHPNIPAPPSLWDVHNLTFMFKNFVDIPDNDRKIIEFFYHMRQDVGCLESIKNDGTLVFRHGLSENDKAKLDEQLRKAMIDVAKITLKEEIDHSLYGVSASYNIENMSPSWKIPDLISGLFFSLFYIKSDMEIYRKCANITCDQYFLVSTTNSKRKYCCPECGNAMAQRMSRKRKKEKETPPYV